MLKKAWEKRTKKCKESKNQKRGAGRYTQVRDEKVEETIAQRGEAEMAAASLLLWKLALNAGVKL